MPILKIDNAESFIGLELHKAQDQIAEHGYECRVIWSDGHTMHIADYKHDYDPLRCNLHVKAGIVVKAVIG